MLELLLLSHFIADFPLQTNKIYAAKVKGFSGVLMHVGVVTLINIVVLLPFLGHIEAWYAIGVILASHTVMDQVKVSITKKYARTDTTLFFAVDQAVHIFTIVFAVIFFQLENTGAEVMGESIIPAWLIPVYTNTTFLLSLSGLLVVSFMGGIILYFITHKKQNLKTAFKYNYNQMFARYAMYLSVLFIGLTVLNTLSGKLGMTYILLILLLVYVIYVVITYGRKLTRGDGMFADTNYLFNIYFPVGVAAFVLIMIKFEFLY